MPRPARARARACCIPARPRAARTGGALPAPPWVGLRLARARRGRQAWKKAEALFKGERPPAPTECTHVDFVHDLPYPKDNLYDEGVIIAELQGLASTPTAG